MIFVVGLILGLGLDALQRRADRRQFARIVAHMAEVAGR